MICYHGSDIVVAEPKILEPQRPLDFSGGFYVTTNEIQAQEWAIKVAYRNNTNRKYINRYDFDLDKAILYLKVIQFTSPDEKWLDFICANRSGRSTGDYDIVIGPVADDKVYRVVVEFENGDIDRKLALQRLKTEKLCDQILFHTEKSLEYLKFLDVREIINE